MTDIVEKMKQRGMLDEVRFPTDYAVRNQIKILLDDMREWYEGFPETGGFSHMLDRYEKERMK